MDEIISTRPVPVLVVTYLRSHNLASIIETIPLDNRKVYIWIDKSEEKLAAKNKEVFLAAQSLSSSRKNVQVHWSSEPVGVSRAIPTALEWVFEFEEKAFILEDDCVPAPGAYGYIDRVMNSQPEGVAIVSCSAPRGFSALKNDANAISVYPLIWGWAIKKADWKSINKKISLPRLVLQTIFQAGRNPRMIPSIGFFLAAEIRVRRGILKAWDGPLVLRMLLYNKRTMVPSINLISNLGADKYAMHTGFDLSENGYITKAEEGATPSLELDMSHTTTMKINKIIETEIFKLKKRHALAPFRAIFWR